MEVNPGKGFFKLLYVLDRLNSLIEAITLNLLVGENKEVRSLAVEAENLELDQLSVVNESDARCVSPVEDLLVESIKFTSCIAPLRLEL